MTSLGMVPAFTTLLQRDLKLAFRRRSELVNPLIFFVMVTSMFPMAVTPERAVLQTMAPGVIWIAALLASMMSLDSIFRPDFEDGTLEQMVLSQHPVSMLVIAKVFAHWLVSGLPLLIVAPLLSVIMYLPTEAIGTLLFTLLLGTPVLSLVGAVGVALTVGLRRRGVLLSLLVMPLYIPVLIFGTSAVDAAGSGLAVVGQLSLLGALLALAFTLSPFAIASALRISMY